MDLDEADIAVLEDTLLQTSSLVKAITVSLNTISTKFSTSRANLKPVITSTRGLLLQRSDVAKGIQTLAAVDASIQRVSALEVALDLPLLATGLKKYIDTLNRSHTALLEMSGSIGQFKGVTSHFESVIQTGEKRLDQSFFDTLQRVSEPFNPAVEPVPLVPTAALKDLRTLVAYKKWAQVETEVVDARRHFFLASLASLEGAAQPRSSIDQPAAKVLGIQVYTSAFCSMAAAEHRFLWALLDDQRLVDWVFGRVMEEPTKVYVQLVAKIAEFAYARKSSDGLMLFDLVSTLTEASNALTSIDPQMDAIARVAVEKGRVGVQVRDLFKDMFAYVESRLGLVLHMPSDNGVSPVIVEVMSRVRQLAKASSPASDIILGMPLGSWIPTPKPQWVGVFSSVLTNVAIDENSGADLLSCYFSDLVDAMMISLEIQCKTFTAKVNRATMGYCLVTNLTLIEQISMSSELHSIMGPNGSERIEKLKKRFMNYFLDGWKGAASILMDVTIITGTDQSGKMSSKEKDAIKEKFKAFNAAIEELMRQHKTYNITDKGLRRYLQKEINFVSPLYRRFYDKYGVMEWARKSKGVVRWDKAEFDGMLESLQ